MNLAFISTIKAIATEWPEDRKSSKESVRYTDYSKSSDQCQVCANFIPDSKCRTVKGPIAVGGWCERYKYAI